MLKLKQGQGPGVCSTPDPGLTELQVNPPPQKAPRGTRDAATAAGSAWGRRRSWVKPLQDLTLPMQSGDQPQSGPGSAGSGSSGRMGLCHPCLELREAETDEGQRQPDPAQDRTGHCLAEVGLLLCINLTLPGPKQLHQAQFIVSPFPGHSFTCSRHCHAAQPICCNRLSKINPSTRKITLHIQTAAELKRQSILTS